MLPAPAYIYFQPDKISPRCIDRPQPATGCSP